ncbi:MAG TPA: hypothetical protein VGX23_04275 [Actinocrinis sp.]|nr:hypothetical protein [Actinocrinis sp.]
MNKNQIILRRTLAAAGVCVAGVMLTACQAATTTTTGSTTVTPSPLITATSTPTAAPTQAPTTTATPAAPATTQPPAAPHTTPPVILKTTPTAVQPIRSQVPVLGTPWNPQIQQGYGQVKPSTINNGGDPTGLVTDVVWSSWGGSTATATGTSEHVSDNESVAQGTEAKATVVAFDLGTCDGKLMYQKIDWYFPSYGQQFSSSRYINICTGDYVGM